ncbi:MAG: TRAP transporter large permease [Syntrophaceae bacterium]|nr:TRAP transporter large permease [Syntrophaceae bacterium]
MESLHVGIIGSILFVALIFLRVPIAYGLGIIGTAGLLYVYGPATVFRFIPLEVYSHTSNFTLSALPLFILMGYLAYYADLSKDSYDAARAWFGKVPGGLAVATVYACAIFGACSGSSLAECAVFSKISVPEMTSSGYNKRLSLGVVAAAGGLDTLIPPSVIMVVFGVMTETSIGQLLIAGIVPGILYACVFAIAIIIFCYLKPSYAPSTVNIDTSWRARMAAIKNIWAVVLLFGLVLGAIYAGWATPDEAAAVGVLGSCLLVVYRKKFTWRKLKDAAVDSAKASAMIFLLFGAASIFAAFLSVTGVISALTEWVMKMKFPFWGIILALMILYLLMGCFLDAISMMVLTMPVVAPIIQAQGASLVWFGVFISMMMVIGAITPPLGLNCYVMKAALGDQVDLNDIFAGAMPFLALMIIIAIIICLFPEISLWLPNMMTKK